MTSRKRVKAGDIIAVSLRENSIAIGMVLYVSKTIRNGIMVGFYNRLFTSIDEVDFTTLGPDFITTPNYTGKQDITTGRWKVIGNRPDLLAKTTIPELRSVSHVYYKDDMVKQISPGEFKNYTELIGQGIVSVENKLRKHFRIE
jgi:hypothetical protein